MSGKKKKVDFMVRPKANKEQLSVTADQWVREGKSAETTPPEPAKIDKDNEKRLTLNLPTALHTAFKARCVVEGVTIQDKVRLLIERELAADKLTGQAIQSPA